MPRVSLQKTTGDPGFRARSDSKSKSDEEISKRVHKGFESFSLKEQIKSKDIFLVWKNSNIRVPIASNNSNHEIICKIWSSFCDLGMGEELLTAVFRLVPLEYVNTNNFDKFSIPSHTLSYETVHDFYTYEIHFE
jgi:phage-related baseplate assembly protein